MISVHDTINNEIIGTFNLVINRTKVMEIQWRQFSMQKIAYNILPILRSAVISCVQNQFFVLKKTKLCKYSSIHMFLVNFIFIIT